MTTFHALELNKNNKCNNKESTIKRDVKIIIIIVNATRYVPSEYTKSLQAIIKELSNAEPRINNKVYLACGFTDLRKSIDGLVLAVQNSLKLDSFEKVLFVFCNRQQNRI